MGSIKVNTVRHYTISKNVDGKKITYLGMEMIGRKKNGSKLKIVSDLLFETPLINSAAQNKALLENTSQLLELEQKKQDLFYKNIKNI